MPAIPYFAFEVMVERHPPPKELAGPHWLWSQGARSEERYDRAVGTISENDAVSSTMRYVGEKSWVDPRVGKAEPWQHELRVHGHATQRPLNFDPQRMMFYCDGRPCVVQRKIYPRRVVRFGEGLQFLGNDFV